MNSELNSIDSLSHLSQSQIQEANEIILELQRRDREERFRDWEPTAPPLNDQKSFYLSIARIIAAFGGNQSGKTEVLVARIISFMQGVHPTLSQNHPVPVFGRMFSPSYEDGAIDVLLKKFMEMVPHEWLKDGNWGAAFSKGSRTISFKNGSVVRFFSYEQDVNKMGGAALDFVALDEHAPEAVFIESMMRLVGRGGWLALSMTPEAGLTWEMDRVIERAATDDRIDYYFFSTYDNPYLTEPQVKFVEDMYSDNPELMKRKMMGQFVALAGLVYPQYVDTIGGGNIIPDHEVPDGAYRVCGVDSHHKKPTAVMWAYWNNDKQFIIYKFLEVPPMSGGVQSLKEKIRAGCGGNHISQWIIDEAMGGEGLNIYGEKSVMEQLKSGVDGIPFEPTGQKSQAAFEAGIFRIRQMLTPDPVTRRSSLYIMKSLMLVRKQFNRYRYRKETKMDEETLRENIANIFDEGPSLARYLTAFPPSGEAIQTEPEVSEMFRRSYGGIKNMQRMVG